MHVIQSAWSTVSLLFENFSYQEVFDGLFTMHLVLTKINSYIALDWIKIIFVAFIINNT